MLSEVIINYLLSEALYISCFISQNLKKFQFFFLHRCRVFANFTFNL